MKELAVDLILVSIFSFVVNSLLPNGRMKRCANLVLSLLLATIILQAICTFFNSFDFEYHNFENNFNLIEDFTGMRLMKVITLF